MLSFHNNQAVKAKYTQRVAMHAAADSLVQGTGWEKGRGCAIGVLLRRLGMTRETLTRTEAA